MRGRLATVACLFILGTADLARAQEVIPLEDAQRYAKILSDEAAKLSDLKFQADLDTDKPHGLYHEQFGAMAIPVKGLKADLIEKAGPEVTPLGHFWMKGLAPVINNAPAENAKLRKLSLQVGDENATVSLYLLAVRKGTGGSPELLIYTTENEPLLTRPIEKGDAAQSYPIEIEGKEDENETGLVTFHLAGRYRTTLRVAPNGD